MSPDHPMPEGHLMGAASSPILPILVAVAVAVAVLGAALAYAAGVVRLHRRGDAWPVPRSGAALVGAAGLLIALSLPARSFPGHAVQHLLLAMAAPAALALSAPVSLALRTLPRRPRRFLLALLHSRAGRVAGLGPVVLLLDLGGLYAYYLTPLFSAAHHRPWLTALVHAHLFLAGCLLSWYLLARDPMPSRPSTRTALVVLFLAAAGHNVLTKLMYANLLPAGAGTAEEIRLGAQIMFYGGDLVELLLATGVLAAWYARRPASRTRLEYYGRTRRAPSRRARVE